MSIIGNTQNHAPLTIQQKINSVSALSTQCPEDTVQTGTGKLDPARKFKCTKAVRDLRSLTLGCKDIGIKKSVFVTKAQFLLLIE